jgi:DNA-binding MltR family transcriptional regulator
MVSVTSGTVFSVPCLHCNHQAMISAGSMMRGTEYICEGCGTGVTFSGSLSHARSTVQVQRFDKTTSFTVTTRPDGVWVFLDDGEKSILDTLDFDSDRAVAIVTGSMIETRLERTLRNRFRPDKRIEGRLFHLSGPLGTFGAKIDIAYAFGLITLDAHRDLTLFKDIRNLFAHNLQIRDFRSRRILDKARNLRLVDDHVAEPSADGKQQRVYFGHRGPALFVTHATSRKKKAKDRYLMTAQLFTVKFAIADLEDYPMPLI